MTDPDKWKGRGLRPLLACAGPARRRHVVELEELVDEMASGLKERQNFR